MKELSIYFEELSGPKRAGGIDTACSQLLEQMRQCDVTILRSGDTRWHTRDPLPDCVHIQGLWSPVLAKRFWFWKKLQVPCVVSPHGMLEAWALSHKFLRKKIAWWLYQRRILNHANALHATSDSEAAQMQRLGLTSKVVVIPWGIEAPQHLPHKESSAQFSTAVFAGRLCPIKGLPMLLQAWKQVQPTNWKLRIIGPDESGYRMKLESLVQLLDLNRDVRFEGVFSKAELQTALKQADLFVLPSYSENFGMVVGEALALGVPVITTRTTPWKRISDMKCGWWVAPNVDELTVALRQATSTPISNLRSMGAIGAELIRREFSWKSSVDKFYQLYACLAKHGTI